MRASLKKDRQKKKASCGACLTDQAQPLRINLILNCFWHWLEGLSPLAPIKKTLLVLEGFFLLLILDSNQGPSD